MSIGDDITLFLRFAQVVLALTKLRYTYKNCIESSTHKIVSTSALV